MFVNGVAFAGDYLSAASFLGICGMIAFYGYDGFLYSIGYLAGWIVALFVIAEPIEATREIHFRRCTDAKFESKASSGRGNQHVGGQRLLPDSADGRCRSVGSTAAWSFARSRRDHRRKRS